MTFSAKIPGWVYSAAGSASKQRPVPMQPCSGSQKLQRSPTQGPMWGRGQMGVESMSILVTLPLGSRSFRNNGVPKLELGNE